MKWGRYTSPLEFMQVYLAAASRVMKEEPAICLQDFRTLTSAEENVVALMMSVAEFVGSREFSDEVFAVFKKYLDYRLLVTPPAGTMQ